MLYSHLCSQLRRPLRGLLTQCLVPCGGDGRHLRRRLIHARGLNELPLAPAAPSMLNAEVWNNSTLVRDDLVNDERVAHHVFDDALVRRDTFGMRGCGRSIWATHRGTARDVVRVGRRQVYLTTRLDETHTPMAHYARTGCLDKREVVLYEVSYDYPTSPVFRLFTAGKCRYCIFEHFPLSRAGAAALCAGKF